MAKTWTDKPLHRQLSGELKLAEDREFERQALRVVQVIWPDVVGAPALGGYDRIGADLLAWSKGPQFDLVIQCKGFKVGEPEVGQLQVNQCLTSITSFAKAGRKTGRYVLLTNRVVKDADFRRQIQGGLRELVDAGVADSAEFWDYRKLVSEAFNTVLGLIRAALPRRNDEFAGLLQRADPPLCAPLESVPLRISLLQVSRYQLMTESHVRSFVADPAAELLSTERDGITVVIGEAGFGKSTSAIRAFHLTKARIAYVRAASLVGNISNAQHLLSSCLPIEEFIPESRYCENPVVKRIYPAVMVQVLKDKSVPLVLIIDALDESLFFSRRGGIQTLFNMLDHVKVPVVLLVRTEFWTIRQTDFSTSVGMIAAKQSNRNMRRLIKLVELLPWTDHEIERLARRYQESLLERVQIERLGHFIDLVKSRRFSDLYGDIPRRPLFLSFILETVTEHDVEKLGRAELVFKWARMKIYRDISAPTMGGEGRRPSITPHEENLDVSVELAFKAMVLAAAQMVTVDPPSLELLPDCALEAILAADRQLQTIVDPTGLFLQSLLIPVKSDKLAGFRVRFAHRTYQEFFLAKDVTEQPEKYRALTLPAAVRGWTDDIRHET